MLLLAHSIFFYVNNEEGELLVAIVSVWLFELGRGTKVSISLYYGIKGTKHMVKEDVE